MSKYCDELQEVFFEIPSASLFLPVIAKTKTTYRICLKSKGKFEISFYHKIKDRVARNLKNLNSFSNLENKTKIFHGYSHTGGVYEI